MEKRYSKRICIVAFAILTVLLVCALAACSEENVTRDIGEKYQYIVNLPDDFSTILVEGEELDISKCSITVIDEYGDEIEYSEESGKISIIGFDPYVELDEDQSGVVQKVYFCLDGRPVGDPIRVAIFTKSISKVYLRSKSNAKKTYYVDEELQLTDYYLEVEYKEGVFENERAEIKTNMLSNRNATSEAGEYALDVKYEGVKAQGTINFAVVKRQHDSLPSVNVLSIGADSITMPKAASVKYAILPADRQLTNDVEWQSGNTFVGLTPDTRYVVYAKYIDDRTYFASEINKSEAVKTIKYNQEKPVINVKSATRDGGIVLEREDGVVYEIQDVEGAEVDDEYVFAAVDANATYVVTAYYVETATHYASEKTELSVTVDKLTGSIVPVERAYVYNGEAQDFAYEIGLSGAMEETEITYYAGDVQLDAAPILPGDYSVKIRYTGSEYLISDIERDYTVSNAVLYVTPASFDIIYGDETPTLTYEFETDAGKGQLFGADELSGMIDFDRSAEYADRLLDVGEYTINVGTLMADRYDIVIRNAAIVVAPKTCTIYPQNLSKTYGDDDNMTYTQVGLLDGDELSGELQRESGENVGNYAVTMGTLANSNYDISLAEDDEYRIFTILPKAVTIIAHKKEKVFGYDDPEFTSEIEGVVIGDEDVIRYELTRDGGENVVEGGYEIKLVVKNDPEDEDYVRYRNYDVSFTSAKFIIKRRNIKIKIKSVDITYGDEPISENNLEYEIAKGYSLVEGYPLVGELSKDDIGYSNGRERADNYTISNGTINNDNNPNYNITFDAGKYNVQPLERNLVIKDCTVVYGDPLPTFELDESSDPLLDGDKYDNGWNPESGSPQYNIYGKNIKAGTLPDVDDYELQLKRTNTINDNYTFVVTPGTLTITKRALSVSFVGYESLSYNGHEPQFNLVTDADDDDTGLYCLVSNTVKPLNETVILQQTKISADRFKADDYKDVLGDVDPLRYDAYVATLSRNPSIRDNYLMQGTKVIYKVAKKQLTFIIPDQNISMAITNTAFVKGTPNIDGLCILNGQTDDCKAPWQLPQWDEPQSIALSTLFDFEDYIVCDRQLGGSDQVGDQYDLNWSAESIAHVISFLGNTHYYVDEDSGFVGGTLTVVSAG